MGGVLTKEFAKQADTKIPVTSTDSSIEVQEYVLKDTNSPTMAPTKTPTPGDDIEPYPPGAIAAIVICTLLFFGAVAFLIYYFNNHNPPQPPPNPPQPDPKPDPKPDPSYGGGGGYGGGGVAKLEDVQSKLEGVQRTTYDV